MRDAGTVVLSIQRTGLVFEVSTEPAERRRLSVVGIVQGVGFRPFVYGLATRHGLAGHVRNDGTGVAIEVEGPPTAIDAFVTALEAEPPPLARIESISAESAKALGARGFEIRASAEASGAPIPPDIATCDDCLAELFDPADRRYRYPFVNCASCGPRFTIVRAAPYDRANTTMAGFPMCDLCRQEYTDPHDRRFHAEPIACPDCGPRLSLPLAEAVALLREGGILAVKGLGGYHLAVNARDERAVSRLRERKRREEKPFAVMCSDPDALAEVSPVERSLLGSSARPVVLMRRRDDAVLAPSVAPGSPWLGLLLPYSPLHHLLLADAEMPLVMTSGNSTDEPIVVGDDEARRRLGGIADAFLAHDRPIHRRCEDSVVRAAFPVRRSRGYAPTAIDLPVRSPRPMVAVGAELKSTFCVVREADAFVSPHLGDLHGEDGYRAFRADLELYLEMLAVRPQAFACDMHPGYLASQWARAQDGELHEVQHHHAHAASCLAEHGESGPALAVVLDGSGYGADGSLWGGEVLRADLTSFERVAWLEPVRLPGGEEAVREPWRVAAEYLEIAGRPVPWEQWVAVRQSRAVNAPLSSGAGRLFDAVSAVLGVRERVSYEGQAAIELEYLAGRTRAQAYDCRFEDGAIAGGDLLVHAHDDLMAGRPARQIAAAFHEGLAAAFARACAEVGAADTVVLSGGAFQNLRLLSTLSSLLERHGFRVLQHRRVPPNDGGIAIGQAAVAAARMSACA